MTLLDYPGCVATTIFTVGCNFRCPFCHNGGLVLLQGEQEYISETEVLAYLKKRQGLLDGICITGGEPTLQKDLEDFIRRVRELGYLVKLDTNGYCPEKLSTLLEEGLLDYVAMDIKAGKTNYALAAGLMNPELWRIEESVRILKNCAIPYEFRTTVVKGIHTVEEFEEIGSWLAGARAYYLQAFQENGNLLCRQAALGALPGSNGLGSLGTFAKKDMEDMAERARKYIDKVALRGVE